MLLVILCVFVSAYVSAYASELSCELAQDILFADRIINPNQTASDPQTASDFVGSMILSDSTLDLLLLTDHDVSKCLSVSYRITTIERVIFSDGIDNFPCNGICKFTVPCVLLKGKFVRLSYEVVSGAPLIFNLRAKIVYNVCSE